MFVFLTLLAFASAAPQFGYRGHGSTGLGWGLHYRPPSDMDHFSGEFFDARRFWGELALEMNRMDRMLEEFSRRFPSTVSDEGIQNRQYTITLSLTGFDEKDIVVKARQGVLMIQAINRSEDGNEKTYIDLRTLPSYVNVNGTWSYDKEVLKITFPLNENPEATTESSDETTTEDVDTTVAPTEDSDKSREEMAPSNADDTRDVDVGLERGDSEREREREEILTNTIYHHTPVEATTYAVDLKNEVEFVPIRMNK